MTSPRPNILFVFADQLRGSSVGHAGEEPVITPHLDAFAQQGIRLTRAVSNAPVCCPMRASLITGQHPLTHGVVTNDVALREDVPCVAKTLAAAGYRTGYIGKWHLDGSDRGGFTPPGPRRQGFDYWAACNCNHLYFESFYYHDSPEPIWIDGYEPTAQTDLAIQYLAQAAQQTDPFCLFLSWGPPHCPYDHVPKRFRDLYDADTLPLRPNVENPKRDLIAGYYAHITALDWNFGRLMRSLDDLGLTDNTLVIFTSDHGDMLFSHNRGWKCKPWRESVIVPFIARWPRHIIAAAEESAPFGLVNVAPTLLNLAGAPIPAAMQGLPLAHLLLSQPGPRPQSTPIYQQMCARIFSFREWRGVVTSTHTYARSLDGPWVLYDDAADPYQLHNLVDQPAARDLQAHLEDELATWLDQLADPFEGLDETAQRYGLQLNANGIYPCYYQPELSAEFNRRAAGREERKALA